jgi:hypothetical protein
MSLSAGSTRVELGLLKLMPPQSASRVALSQAYIDEFKLRDLDLAQLAQSTHHVLSCTTQCSYW